MATKRSTSAFLSDDKFGDIFGIEADDTSEFDGADFPAFYEAVECRDGNIERLANFVFLPKVGHA